MQNIEQIYEEYFNTVYKYLLCLTRDKDVAEELTQETFYRAVKKIHTFKGNCKISVWLCQIAKNLWYDEIAKRKKFQYSKEENMDDIEDLKNIEDTVITNSEKMQLYKNMQRLDELTREVIYLRITGELNFKEIGIILNKTENWARVTFYRGKKKLKEVEENEKK